MPILKPIDDTFVCPVAEIPSDILDYLAQFNDILYVETDQYGAELDNLEPTEFFMVNRVLSYNPVVTANALRTNVKFSSMRYNCLLTIARPVNQDLEIATGAVQGQFDEITKEFLTLGFVNTFRSYFACCGYHLESINIRPIWNSTAAVVNVSHSGIEINFNVTI